jgi:GT2 family glycosyltransferase
VKVDVIIPVYNQRESLLLTLVGFQKQIGNSQFHIIIVDDGSKEDISDLVTMFKDLDITYIYQENNGRAKARNVAIRYTESEYIIFCDADRIPGPDFVESHILRLKEKKDLICIGNLKEVYFSKPENNRAKIMEIVQSNSKIAREPMHSKNVDYLYDERGKCISQLPWISTYSGNMSMKRTVIDRVGGFDENFTSWGFEHFELGYRIYKSGIDFVRVRNAINYHVAHSREKDFYLNSIIKSHEYFFSKHPTKEIYLLKKYMLGEISLQEYEYEVAGEVKWENAAEKTLYIKL